MCRSLVVVGDGARELDGDVAALHPLVNLRMLQAETQVTTDYQQLCRQDEQLCNTEVYLPAFDAA
jgi:hypothetical protein